MVILCILLVMHLGLPKPYKGFLGMVKLKEATTREIFVLKIPLFHVPK